MVSGRSLVEDAVSGAKIAVAPCHLALAVAVVLEKTLESPLDCKEIPYGGEHLGN